MSDYFSDPEGTILTYSIKQTNGNPPPAFMQVDYFNNTINGFATNFHIRTWNFIYTAVDAAGIESSTNFVIDIGCKQLLRF